MWHAERFFHSSTMQKIPIKYHKIEKKICCKSTKSWNDYFIPFENNPLDFFLAGNVSIRIKMCTEINMEGPVRGPPRDGALPVLSSSTATSTPCCGTAPTRASTRRWATPWPCLWRRPAICTRWGFWARTTWITVSREILIVVFDFVIMWFRYFVNMMTMTMMIMMIMMSWRWWWWRRWWWWWW